MKAMIFAAGLGTRLGEETQNKPKALVEIGGKPLLQHVIEKLVREGTEEVVVNVHHFSGQILQFLSDSNFNIPVHISDESDKLLDTGGGLKKAATILAGDSPIILYNVDVLSNLNISLVTEQHLQSGAMATLVVRDRKTKRYFLFNKQKTLVGWLNKETGDIKISRKENSYNLTEMAFSGIHVIQPEIFNYMPNADRFSITELYLELAKKHIINGFFDDSDLWMDVGKPDQLVLARELYL